MSKAYPTPEETFQCYEHCEALRELLEPKVPLHPEPLRLHPQRGGWVVEVFTVDPSADAANAIAKSLALLTRSGSTWPLAWRVRLASGPLAAPGCWPTQLPEPWRWKIKIQAHAAA